MTRPVVTTVAAALLVALALTGCGRGETATGGVTPTDPASVQESSSSDLGSIDDELAAIDDVLAQSTEDGGAGDSAAATDDQP